MSHANPLVRHLVARAGTYSEIWLDAQIENQDRYRVDAWALEQPPDGSVWRSEVRWIEDVSVAARVWRRLRLKGAGPIVRTAGELVLRAGGPFHKELPDVAHAHFGPVAWEWLPVVRRMGSPLVVSFYGLDASQERFKREPWLSRYESVFDVATRYLVEGPSMKRRVAALGAPEEWIHIVRLPFTHTDLAQPHTASNSPDRDVIMAGRFVEKKGFDDGLRACAQALGRDVSALVIGEGPCGEAWRRLAEELGLDNVVFRPPVPIQELAELMARSRVALFPSRTASDGDGEGGAPLTLTLAQYVGTRAVVTDHDDLPFAAVPGTAVVQEGDVDGLATALSTVHEQAAAGSREDRSIRRAGQEFVITEHDPRDLTRQREQVYDLARQH